VNLIKLEGLNEGCEYILTLKKEAVNIRVIVCRGQEWNVSKGFLLTEKKMIERNFLQQQYLRVDNITVKNVEVEDDSGFKKTV